MRGEVGKETPKKEIDLDVFLWSYTWPSRASIKCFYSCLIHDCIGQIETISFVELELLSQIICFRKKIF